MENNFDRRAFLKVGSLRLFGFIGYGDVLRLRAQAPAPPTRDPGRNGVRVNCVASGPERASE